MGRPDWPWLENFQGEPRVEPLLLNWVGSIFILKGWPFSVVRRGLGSMFSCSACWLRKVLTAVVSSDVGGRAKAVVYMVVMRCSGDASLVARVLVAQSAACCWMKGSFMRMRAWAGTLETLRRPMV